MKYEFSIDGCFFQIFFTYPLLHIACDLYFIQMIRKDVLGHTTSDHYCAFSFK